MLRLMVLSPLAALLAVASVAFADEAGIVDPWANAPSAWFATPGLDPATAVARAPQTVAAPPPRSDARVLPLAKAPGDHTMVVEPWNPEPFEAVADPWLRPARRLEPAPPPLVVARNVTGHADWAYAVREIVDPWRRGWSGISPDPLIVDPWAK
ncbi:MAG TPA: hypothetical protein VGK73_27585 [Polyangiaceae bacterium]